MTRSTQIPHRHSDVLFDELLVIMARDGDKRAFERLYARWQSRLLRAALRYTGNAEAAGDLAQECWLGVWKGLSRLRDPANFRSFLFGILHRRGADHVRAIIRLRERTGDLPDGPEPSEPARQSDHSAIMDAFATLAPEQRLAAHLHFVEGLTLAEIADVQSIPAGTAKSRLFHARRKLKAALSDATPRKSIPSKEIINDRNTR